MAERPMINENLTNIELLERYRLNRQGLDDLEEILHDRLLSNTARNFALSPMEKILLTLRYYATGGIQRNDGDIHHVHQSTVSRSITEVTDVLCDPQISTRFIEFPRQPHIIERIQQGFQGIAGFPHVVGVIDCTHVQIKAPTHEEATYVNRMGYHSINTQIVFDDTDNITDMVCRWPGSTHDSRILRQSGLFQLFEGGHIPGEHRYLLGDSGYPCKKWLLTPFLHPITNSEMSYNRAHKKTRCKVERGIGQLKRRWGILNGEVRLAPEKACKVVMACGVLHNFCKQRNIPLIDIQDGGFNNQPINIYNGPGNGLNYRNFIANTYF